MYLWRQWWVGGCVRKQGLCVCSCGSSGGSELYVHMYLHKGGRRGGMYTGTQRVCFNVSSLDKLLTFVYCIGTILTFAY